MGFWGSIFGRNHSPNLREEDAAVFDQLEQNGADLSRSRHVLHYFYLPTPEAAELAADELASVGYEVRLGEPSEDRPAEWLVLAERQEQIDRHNFPDIRTSFDSLATRLGGTYDGWEASV